MHVNSGSPRLLAVLSDPKIELLESRGVIGMADDSPVERRV